MPIAQVIENDNQITVITEKGNVATGSHNGSSWDRDNCMERVTKEALDKD